jgi:8-hydroxy-5-deazaflavin:NADPH oxidoreductase
MKIGIIGAGKIGGTLARLFSKAGHQVALSNSRGPDSLANQAQQLGPNVKATTVDDAANFGDVVFLSIPFGQYQTVPAKTLVGKIVVDGMNYYPERDGQMDFGGVTSSEVVARYLLGARLVKSFNTMYFQTLGQDGKPNAPESQRLALFVAGDDSQAKETVCRLIEEIGFAPVDTGSLSEGGSRQQPGSPIYARSLTATQARETLAGKAA